MADNTKLNYADVEKVRNAWSMLLRLRDPRPAKMIDTMKELMEDREVTSGLLDVYTKMRDIVQREEEDSEDEEEEQPRRLLRWQRAPRERVFTNLMNIACFRCARDEEARKARGERDTLPIPYGVEESVSVRLKVKNYRTGLTGQGNFSGADERYATSTIRLLCEFNPTDEELDEAAEYYRRNPE